MVKFKSILAFKIFNLAIKVEKMSIDSKKTTDMEQLEIYAELQNQLEENINKMYKVSSEVATKIKELKKVKREIDE